MSHFDETGILHMPVSRRDCLKGLGVGALAASLPLIDIKPAFAMKQVKSYRVAFRNAHTGESFNGVYRVGNKYLPEAFERINVVLRDFRAGIIYPIDPRVIDIITAVQKMTGEHEAFDVISGYRTPKTNSMLRTEGGRKSGVAKHSLHMTGQAIDLRLPGYSTRRIRDLGIKLHAGGVGYYRKSDFVHLDSGDVRTW
ncbi:MAG: DUF882 domain-containing protein [Alphaproteobacteria bacterium]|nr:DUF882 domain-containing protein [Alphaproteobacteria bacterium]